LPEHSEASFAFILFDMRENFVGASSPELWAQSQVGRGVPDRLDLAWEFKVGFLLARQAHEISLNHINLTCKVTSASLIHSRRMDNGNTHG
jgi:hypothetical protein